MLSAGKHTASLGVNYAAAQRLQLSLKVPNQQRNSTILDYSYNDNAIVADASFSFQNQRLCQSATVGTYAPGMLPRPLKR